MNILNAKKLPCSLVGSLRESVAVRPNNPKDKVQERKILIVLLSDIYLLISFQRSGFKVGGRKKGH